MSTGFLSDGLVASSAVPVRVACRRGKIRPAFDCKT